ALFADTSLLPFRLHPVLELVLTTAGIFGVAELLRHVRGWGVVMRWAVPVTALVVIAGVLGAVSLQQKALTGNLAGGIQLAYEDYYPSGVNAQGARDSSADGAYNAEVSAAIEDLSGRAPANNVVLTTNF